MDGWMDAEMPRYFQLKQTKRRNMKMKMRMRMEKGCNKNAFKWFTSIESYKSVNERRRSSSSLETENVDGC